MSNSLLAILAHPDDESFGPGGTLARYAQEGVDVHVAIATDGAAGSVAEGYESDRAELAAVRAKELEAAVEILGVKLHLLGYRDSGYIGDKDNNEHPDAFIQADLEESTGRIVKLIRELRPTVLMTHDENGGYFHPDHIRCNVITRAAFAAAGDETQYPEIGPAPFQPERLYYTAFPNTLLKFFIFMLKIRRQDPTKQGRNKDIDLTRIGMDAKEIDTRINMRMTWEIKREAGKKHATQGGGSSFFRFLPQWILKQLFGNEHFVLVEPKSLKIEGRRDLFTP